MIEDLIVRFVPAAIREADPGGRCVVMADILRASTTMVHALVNGATAIYPQAEIQDSLELAAQLGESTLIGGERNGQIVDGFDYGNSPLEYTAERISGRKLVLCTSNGTFTLTHCKSADRVLIGAFVNLDAICDELCRHSAGMVACAGTNRMVTDEDVLFAGAVATNLQNRNPEIKLDDAAKIAAQRWQTVSATLTPEMPLWKIFAQSHGGRNLMRLKYQHDVEFCSQTNLFTTVPELDLNSWVIQAAV